LNTAEIAELISGFGAFDLTFADFRRRKGIETRGTPGCQLIRVLHSLRQVLDSRK
jgi:hypothetical protein